MMASQAGSLLSNVGFNPLNQVYRLNAYKQEEKIQYLEDKVLIP